MTVNCFQLRWTMQTRCSNAVIKATLAIVVIHRSTSAEWCVAQTAFIADIQMSKWSASFGTLTSVPIYLLRDVDKITSDQSVTQIDISWIKKGYTLNSNTCGLRTVGHTHVCEYMYICIHIFSFLFFQPSKIVGGHRPSLDFSTSFCRLKLVEVISSAGFLPSSISSVFSWGPVCYASRPFLVDSPRCDSPRSSSNLVCLLFLGCHALWFVHVSCFFPDNFKYNVFLCALHWS